MSSKSLLKIGNAQSFWGDSPRAPYRLAIEAPDMDVLTLDYLSEVSMSIMAVQKAKNPTKGYAEDFLEVIRSLIPLWKQGRKLIVIANAGGLNPQGCAEACHDLLVQANLNVKIGVVTGDNVISALKADLDNPLYLNAEDQTSLAPLRDKLTTANAYLGAHEISKVLQQGAQIVVTGRVADPSLVVGACAAHFSWSWNEYDKLAGATIAGHLIECGTQVTGGISCNWMQLEDCYNIGYPIVEIDEKGEFIITKPRGTGGMVNEWTVKEQLLYEIGDPERYLSPDVTVSFLSLKLAAAGENRILVQGAKGLPPTDYYKVSATYQDGFKAEAFLTLFGENLREKAKKCGDVIYRHVEQDGYRLERYLVECLGSNDVVPGVFEKRAPLECVLRIAAADSRKEALEYFSKEIAPLVCCGPAGVTGYASGRPKIRPVYGYWPCLIAKKDCQPKGELL